MLASIIANLQNVPQLPAAARLPVVKIDRGGGGGPSWPGGYDVVDIMAAIQLFPEVAGEDQVVRAVRRMRWIGEALPRIKEAREKREASAFLVGATLANTAAEAAAEEREKQAVAAVEERYRLLNQLKIEQLVEIIDDVRKQPKPQPSPKPNRENVRGGGGSNGLVVAALAFCAIGAIGLIAQKRR